MGKGIRAARTDREARSDGRRDGRSNRTKPAKPYKDFPLFPHATGRWAKKIKGRFAFFGRWDDPTGAFERYLAERDALYAGRLPRTLAARAASGGSPASGAVRAQGGNGANDAAAPATGDGLQVRDLVNHFLTAKQRRVDAGEMGLRSFSEYHAAAGRLVKTLGSHRRVDDIDPADFARHRATLAKTRGPVALGNEVGRVRSIFKYGYEAGLLDRPVRFGPEFVKPPKRSMRLARRARGARMFEPKEIKKLLAGSGVQMRAMILLGLNCGMGNTDVASLSWNAIDLKQAIVEMPRPKTGIARRAMLWPETIDALKVVRTAHTQCARGKPITDLVFITKYGNPWVRVDEPGLRSKGRNKAVVKDSVAMEFGKIARETGLAREGRGFYALRHTFRTVADEVGDRRAVDLIMGHENGQDIATEYVERIGDDRLARVALHVRAWVLGTMRSRQAASGSRRLGA